MMDIAAFKNWFVSNNPVFLREHKVAYIQKIFGRNIVFGMEWYLVAGQNDKEGIRKACRESSGEFGVLLNSRIENESGSEEVECVIGIPANVRRLSRAVAAASVVSRVYETAIVVVPLDHEHYWLLALTNGVPVIGKDLVLGAAKTRQITHELLMAYPDFELVGDAAFWQETRPGAGFVEESLYTLISHDRISRVSSLVRFDRQWQGAGIVFFASVIVAGIAYSFSEGWIGFGQRHSIDSHQQDQQLLWDEQISRDNAALVSEYNQVAINYPVGKWIQRLVITADQLQLEARGWRLKSLFCDHQAPICTASWVNQGVGTFKGLVDSVGRVGEIQFNSPLEVTQSIPVQSADTPVFDETAVLQAINTMPDQKQFHINHVSVLQALASIPAIEAGLNPALNKTVGSQQPTPPDVVERIKPLGAFTIGSWHLSGQGIQLLIGSLQKLDARVFFGKSLQLEFNRDNAGEYSVRWRVEGDYVVKP